MLILNDVSIFSVFSLHLVGPKVENTPESGISIATILVPIVPKVIESLRG